MTEMLEIEAVDTYAQTVRGSVTRPRDPEYDEVRALYNAMIDKRPALIARCRDVADVIATVNFARNSGLDIAIRGGSHNGGGLGSVDDGVVIDLAPMNYIRVDPDAGTATAGGGALLGDLDHATQAFGAVVPAGILSTEAEPAT